MNQMLLNSVHKEFVEPRNTAFFVKDTVEIVGAKYKTTEVPKAVAENCSHQWILKQVKLL